MVDVCRGETLGANGGHGPEYYCNVQLSPELEEAAARVQQEVSAEREAEERELEMMRQEGEAEGTAAE